MVMYFMLQNFNNVCFKGDPNESESGEVFKLS